MQRSTLRLAFAFVLAAATASVAAAWPARATEPDEALSTAPPVPPPRIEWGLRPSASTGVGGEGFDGRVGLDGEYWLTRNVGIGAAFGFQASTTVIVWPSESGSSGSERRFSLAPALTLRGNDPVRFPIVSLAVGHSWGHRDEQSFCDSADVTCMPSSASTDVGNVYSSLAATWTFHPGGPVRPGAVAFTIGPVVRLECWLYHLVWQSGWSFDSYAGSLTVGIAMGFDVARTEVR